MLVLTRKSGEKIVVSLPGGGEITFELLLADRGKARIGIEAPREVPVHRQEVYERMQAVEVK